MKIAITGSNGFIGRMCIESLKDSADVLALYRKEDGALSEEVLAVNHVCTDYSFDDLMVHLKGCDAVIHLAAQKVTPDNEKKGLTGYVPSLELNETVLQTCCELGIKNVTVMSSRCVYGTYTDDAFRETDVLHPINFYGVSKIAIESDCMYYNDHFDMNVKVLRLGQVVGPNMQKAMFSVFFERAKNNEPLTLIGNDIRDYIYVKDVCKAIICSVMAADAGGIYNIGMGKPYDNLSVAKEVIKSTASDSSIQQKESSPDYKPWRILMDCSKAKEELGFECDFKSFEAITDDILNMH